MRLTFLICKFTKRWRCLMMSMSLICASSMSEATTDLKRVESWTRVAEPMAGSEVPFSALACSSLGLLAESASAANVANKDGDKLHLAPIILEGRDGTQVFLSSWQAYRRNHNPVIIRSPRWRGYMSCDRMKVVGSEEGPFETSLA